MSWQPQFDHNIWVKFSFYADKHTEYGRKINCVMEGATIRNLNPQSQHVLIVTVTSDVG